MTAKINPLANPKGVKRLCELCQKPAYLQCTKCRVTFYCDETHQQADWNSIHEKVCELLITLRGPTQFFCSQTERERHRAQIQEKMEELMMLAYTEAQIWLLKLKPAEVMPAARLFLRCVQEVYGSDATELMPAYMLLAEANTALGYFSQAKRYLYQGVWAVMKTPHRSGIVLYQLHRSMGCVYFGSQNYNTAQLHFASAVYHASEEYGLDTVEVAGCYFFMANVFTRTEMPDVGRLMYSKVTSIWHSHLSKLMEFCDQTDYQKEKRFDEVHQEEADYILRVILESQEQVLNTNHAHPEEHEAHAQCLQLSVLLSHSRAMLWFLCNNFKKAVEFGKKALEFDQQCEKRSLTKSIQSLVQQAEKHLETQESAPIPP